MQFFTIVPEKSVKMLHRFGKFTKTLNPGFHIFIPFINTIEHHVDLKETALVINEQ